MIKTRFAPSPTGNPHVGNMRTALYTYLFAKKNKGKFILRVEDTDKKREVKESYQAIEDSLKWLGIEWDEGPILQSERLKIYQKYANKLVSQGLAYEQEGAIHFKVKRDGATSWIDLIGNKKIEFENKLEEDFIILKSDGYPVYHLAAVVDDHLMEITHVTRGEDWISSTPKHLMLYGAFGWEPPLFVHFPNILASDRSKLSKRHGAIGILDFKKEGFLPEALVNFLAILGWTPPSGREILSPEEMIKEFDLKNVHTTPAIFDVRKLEWMSGEYIRRMGNQELAQRLEKFLEEMVGKKMTEQDKQKIIKLTPLVKERIKKLIDFIPLTDFVFNKPEYDKKVFEKLNPTAGRAGIKNQKEVLEKVLEKLEKMDKPWKAMEFEQTFRKLAEELDIKPVEIFQLIRVAISGQLVTPPLFECIQILGEEETLRRVRDSVKFLS